ncbi:hypothetical protein AB0K48_09730 [Nonomuraea sp. NPDC055795]
MEQAHITGELYYRLGDIYVQVAQQEEQLVRIQDLRTALRDAYDPLARCARVVLLEGPEVIAKRVEAVKQAATDANGALWFIAQEAPEARSRFDNAHQVFRDQLQSFIETARTTIGSP